MRSPWFTGSATLTSAETGNFGQASVIRTVTNNPGYFAQGQLAVDDALFLSGGVRAEENSNFGAAVGTPVSPQVGFTHVRPAGPATVKLRGSWGRAIRPPNPGDKFGGICSFAVPRGAARLPGAPEGGRRPQGCAPPAPAADARRGGSRAHLPPTLQKIERGDPGVSLRIHASVLHGCAMPGRLEHLAAAATDRAGAGAGGGVPAAAGPSRTVRRHGR